MRYKQIKMMQMIEMEMIHKQIIRAREHSKNDLLETIYNM